MNRVLEFISNFQAFPALLKWPVLALSVLLVLTFFGRIYCKYICALGVTQSVVNKIFHRKANVRRVCSRLPESKVQRVVRWSVFSVFVLLISVGLTGIASMIEPWSIFGKACTFFVPGLAVFSVILILSAFSDGRFWCNWICPLGTVFNLFAKYSRYRDKVGKNCGLCRKCFDKNDACSSRNENCQVTRRDALQAVAVLAADKLTDGGFEPVSLPGVPARKRSVLPPGAVDRNKFFKKCIGCGVCVASCPGDCLKGSLKFGSFGQVELDFTRGYCRYKCDYLCARICPSGALENLQGIERKDVHIGHAVLKSDLCVRNIKGDKCLACVRKCPVNAVKIIGEMPVIDKRVCIGCGACEHVCPARPMPAIFVSGLEKQRVVRPMNESDLISEMSMLIERGQASVVVAKAGVIKNIEKGSGIRPLYELYLSGDLTGAVVADKVIGRAAAAILAAGKARVLFAGLISEDAIAILENANIKWSASKKTDKILNRAKTDCCPFETMVSGKTDVLEMVEIIGKALNK